MSLIDQPYRQTARRSFQSHVMLVSGLVFVAASFAVDPAIHCRESHCPGWLLWVAFALGALFALGGAVAILRNGEWGSRFDHQKRQFIWWHGVPPLKERAISIDDIAEVRVDTSGDTDTLRLIDRTGKLILFQDSCVPPSYEAWADALARHYPHVKVTLK